MAALYGRLQGSRGEVTRMGTRDIFSKLETWHGSIQTTLKADGSYYVYIGDKSFPRTLIAEGKIDA